MDENDRVNKETFQRFLYKYPTLIAHGAGVPYVAYGKSQQEAFSEERIKLEQEQDNFFFCYELIKNLPEDELLEMVDVSSFSIAETYRRESKRNFSDGVFILALYAHGIKLEKILENKPLMLVIRNQPENSMLYPALNP